MPRTPTPASAPAPPARSRDDALLEGVAWLMDRAFRVPGTNFRVGLDPLLGLIPGLGDVSSAVVQVALILIALYRYRLPRAVVARMAANVLLDTGLGAIPVLGDVFDFGFRSNTRNLQLIREARGRQLRGDPVPTGPSVRFLVGLGAILGILLVLILIGAIALVLFLIRLPSYR